MTSIVMLCHNRLRLLQQALRTLYDNTPREEFNLTLVDDASTDFRVRNALESWSQAGNATLLRIEKSSHVLARAKNIGVAWSEQTFGRGEWLYLSDSDVAFTSGWLEKMITTAIASESDHFNLWGGQAHPYHQASGNYGMENVAYWTEHAMLDGPSWLMRWKTWDEIGPLSRDHAPGTCQSEDVEFCRKLTAQGSRIGVIHPHVVAHTGLTNTNGEDAPGREARESQRIPGVIYE